MQWANVRMPPRRQSEFLGKLSLKRAQILLSLVLKTSFRERWNKNYDLFLFALVSVDMNLLLSIVICFSQFVRHIQRSTLQESTFDWIKNHQYCCFEVEKVIFLKALDLLTLDIITEEWGSVAMFKIVIISKHVRIAEGKEGSLSLLNWSFQLSCY